MLAERNAPVDFIVLSGFLGSGKTTLLLDYLNQGGAEDTGVIVNEVGEIGIDGAIVADGSDSVPMAMLANGCVCCSLRSGLVHTVTALLDAPRPAGRGPLRRIILETSGLSRPGPIIASLADPDLAGKGLRLAVTSTYDCQTGALNVENFDEAAAQLAAAQRIVFTKLDKVSADAAAEHRRLVEGINPLASIVLEARREQAVREAFAGPASDADPVSLAARALRSSSALRSSHPRIRVMTAMVEPAATWNDLALWLDNLAGFCGERLLRVKAIVKVSDCDDPVLIQSVGTTFSAPRRMSAYMGSGLFTVIARDVDAEQLNGWSQQSLVRLCAT